MTRRIAATALAVALAALLLAPARAAAGERPTVPDKAGAITLEVTVIQASNEGTAVDPKLAPLRKYFESSFKRFTRFEHLGEHQATVPEGGETTTQVVGSLPLTMRFLGRDQGLLRVQVDFAGAKMTMKVRDGRLWFHAGRKHGSGILVLALVARGKQG
jgi:hypothetical protein